MNLNPEESDYNDKTNGKRELNNFLEPNILIDARQKINTMQ